MDVLVLGGTQFSGRAFSEQAVRAGHRVTLLHRSANDPGIPGIAQRLVGDRDAIEGDGLAQLDELLAAGRTFDAVVDMCGYVPRVVRASCELLARAAGRYLFVSSVSVYPMTAGGSPDEDSPVIELDDPATEAVTGDTYGGLKALCEREVLRAFGNRTCIVRPGLIVGPNDPTDRFTWWTRVLATEPTVLLPDPGGLASFIDARDLATFYLRCIEQGHASTFNAAGPAERMGLPEFVRELHGAVDSRTALIATRERWLLDQGVEPWRDVPVWLPSDTQSLHRASAARARDHGLQLRPLTETARDTAAWDARRGSPELKSGLTPAALRAHVAALQG
ncbi:MAG: NAD-dependent epimerase/dehydratase family protein [Planctomycetota bacterium]